MKKLIYLEDAIDALMTILDKPNHAEFLYTDEICKVLNGLPPAQQEIIRCKDCKYGDQDEVGRWFCRSLGCQIGSEDGSGFCADAERRTDEETNLS